MVFLVLMSAAVASPSGPGGYTRSAARMGKVEEVKEQEQVQGWGEFIQDLMVKKVNFRGTGKMKK